MTDADKQEILFYQGSGIQHILNRFMFTEKERKLIEDAIRTSNMSNPRMQLIYDANALLKKVAKTREPIQNQIIDDADTIKAMAKAGAPMPQKRLPFSLYWLLLPLIIGAVLVVKNSKDNNLHSFEEAKAYCKSKNQLLPLSKSDILITGHKIFKGQVFWSNDGNLITFLNDKQESDNQPHHVFCVDMNNIEDLMNY